MLEQTIAAIRHHHRERCYWMTMRIALRSQLEWFLKLQLGWSKALPKADRDAIAKQAEDLIAFGEKMFLIDRLTEKEAESGLTGSEKGQRTRALKKTATPPPDWSELSPLILSSLYPAEIPKQREDEAVAEMDALARQLPVWPWWQAHVFSESAASLAIIVAEAGDLSHYPKKGHLWKRMGVAVMDGIRQGGLRKTASAEDWIEHGYNRQRRSRMWNIGEKIIRKSASEYRQVYLKRKDFERKRAEANGLTVAPSAKIPAGRKDEFISDMHIHRRAQRYMEKRLLRDLWQAWRARRRLPDRAMTIVPATEHANAA